MFVLNVMGQQVPMLNAGKKGVPVDAKYLSSLNSFNTRSSNTERSTSVNHWLEYDIAVYNLEAGQGEYFNWPLFDDSSVFFTFNIGTKNVFTEQTVAYSVGQTFNAYSSIIGSNYSINLPSSEGYTLDSIAVPIDYIRLDPDTSVADTLLINLYQGQAARANGVAFPIGYFTATPDTYYHTWFGVDTVFVPSMYYNYLKFGPLASYYASVSATITTIKIPLHQSDTAAVNSNHITAVPGGGLQVAAGNLVGCTVSFKPGFAYSPGDTINLQHNYCGIVSLAENGGNDGEPLYTVGDFDDSYIVPKEVQYNQSPTPYGWDSSYIPMSAYFPYNGGFPMDDHRIIYHIVYDSVSGIQRVNSTIASQSIYPNPASDITTLQYTLKTTANVVINVSDITGKLIRTENEGNLNPGLNQQLINTSDLVDGVYMVSIIANGNTSVSKLVVAR